MIPQDVGAQHYLLLVMVPQNKLDEADQPDCQRQQTLVLQLQHPASPHHQQLHQTCCSAAGRYSLWQPQPLG
jgi:hypothetical protein